jgi:hypothetical protein
MQISHTAIDGQAVVRTSARLGDRERLVTIGYPVGKSPQLPEALNHVDTRLDRAEENNATERLGALLPVEGRQDLLQVRYGLTVVAQAGIDLTHIAIDPYLEVDVSEGCCNGVDSLAVGQRRFVVLHLRECRGYTVADVSQAAVIRQPFGECFRLAQVRKPLRPLSEHLQRHG